jgi:hypothetical protein
VHPVAGRCKHCGDDLVAAREARKREARRAAQAAAAAPEVTSPPAAATRTGLYVAALLVLFVGVGGGVAAQRLVADGRSSEPRSAPANTPTLFDPHAASAAPTPDLAPMPRFDPYRQGDPFGRRAPDPTAPGADPFGALDPLQLLDQMLRGQGFAPHSGSPPDLADPTGFAPAMAQAVCGKLAQCGLVDDAMAGLCQMVGSQLQDDELLAAIRRGDCRYDAGAAKECIGTVGGMSCDSDADADRLLALASGAGSCLRAFDCR